MRRKQILVPTDFRVASLNPLKLAVELSEEPVVDAVLLYCERLDTSITELLFYSAQTIIRRVQPPDFADALSMLTNRFGSRLGEVRIEVFHGHRQATFDSLLDTLRIEAIYVPKPYSFHTTGRAFDPLPFIRRSPVPHYEMQLSLDELALKEDKLEHLFM